MLYHWYELGHAAVSPARMAADAGRFVFSNPFNPLTHTHVGRQAAAACEVFERTTRRYDKPGFGLDSIDLDGEPTPIVERIAWQQPFCRLIHFDKGHTTDRAAQDPRILLVAPMSGHYATLLRGTVEALLPNHDVYITDWQDARDVSEAAGTFDLDDYIDYVRAMITYFEGDVHVFAVCQPSVPVLAAIALMEQDNDPNVPHSMVLAGGPIDTRINPTIVNQLAADKGIDWFRDNVVTTVPWPNDGHGRRVYPGFLQLTGFMTMNLDRHLNAHRSLFEHLVEGDGDSAEKHRDFYDEYLAVMDLTAEFYLQTVETVFIEHVLAEGRMHHRGRCVTPSAIRRVALMTIEGEKDDITGVGQCSAAHQLCDRLPSLKKQHYEAQGVGHYGIFNGSRFRSLIVPRIAGFMRRNDPAREEQPDLSIIDFDAAAARANGHAAAPDAAAFTFAPANDVTADSVTIVLKKAGLGSTASPEVAEALAEQKSPLAALQLWTFATAWMLDSMFGPLVERTNSQRAGNSG